MGATGKKIKGPYTFVYVYEDGEWKINHHHSSVLPEGIVTAEPINNKKEVRGLFDLWNNALAIPMTNWAQDAGIYKFTIGATGAKVKGRYTFAYVYEDGKWKISQHHSSVTPEASKPKEITEEEVKNLFPAFA
jgi:hypothetical protein